MRTALKYHGTLHATLCEIERGVFYANYPDCRSASATDALTHYQTGRSAESAKHRIEQLALTLGYESVVWSETITAPLFANALRTARHDPAPSLVPRFGNLNMAAW